MHFTNEQHVLLSNLKMLTAVRNGDTTLPYLSLYDIHVLQSLITNLATS